MGSNVSLGTVQQRIADRINGSKIAGKLIAHIENPKKTPMLTTQIQAAKILLAKVSPDLKAVEQTIRDERAKTKQEIFAHLTTLGLDPKEIWQSVSKH